MFLFKDFVIDYYIKNGFPKEKLSLGIGLFGICFQLTDGFNQNGILAPAANRNIRIPIGPYSKQKGMLHYNEVRYQFSNFIAFFIIFKSLPAFLSTFT